MSQSYTGISFPFRIGVKGGVVMSTTTSQDAQHIVESLIQIIGTRPMERVMEYHIKSEVSTYIFDPNDESTRALVAYECQKAIEECDDRVEVLAVDVSGEDHTIYANISFRVKKYEPTYSVNIKVGEY
jgi:phage baseplate assembly protein W